MGLYNTETKPMLYFHLELSVRHKKALEKQLRKAKNRGDTTMLLRILSILCLAEDNTFGEVAALLAVCEDSVRSWFRKYTTKGIEGLFSKKSPGRPPKLTKSQRKKLAQLIDEGPVKAGYMSNCWRSPMIQDLIQKHFGVLYSVKYISQLLSNMGYSYQKARFVSDHLDAEAREKWLNETWPKILDLAKRRKAYLLFGDEASFPQWGTLSHTWAKKGQQPTIKTSGKRKGYKVFGLIDYFTGRFFQKCQEERFNSETYIQFLKEVLVKTRKHIVLIQDGARYHTSKATRAFIEEHAARLTVYNLPSYSPDYNPIEMLWKKVKEEGTHLQYFPTFDALKKKVHDAVVFFEDAAHEVLALFGLYRKISV
jgi:transposase